MATITLRHQPIWNAMDNHDQVHQAVPSASQATNKLLKRDYPLSLLRLFVTLFFFIVSIWCFFFLIFLSLLTFSYLLFFLTRFYHHSRLLSTLDSAPINGGMSWGVVSRRSGRPHQNMRLRAGGDGKRGGVCRIVISRLFSTFNPAPINGGMLWKVFSAAPDGRTKICGSGPVGRARGEAGQKSESLSEIQQNHYH